MRAKLLIDCWAQLRHESDMLNRAINQLPKTDDGYQGQGVHVKFRLD